MVASGTGLGIGIFTNFCATSSSSWPSSGYSSSKPYSLATGGTKTSLPEPSSIALCVSGGREKEVFAELGATIPPYYSKRDHRRFILSKQLRFIEVVPPTFSIRRSYNSFKAAFLTVKSSAFGAVSTLLTI